MKFPKTREEALKFFKKDKIVVIGKLKNQWSKDKNHSYSVCLKIEEFNEIYPGLKSKALNKLIHNFLHMHHKSHDNKEIKITMEVL